MNSKSLSICMNAMESKVNGATYSPHRGHSSMKSKTDNDDSDEGDLIFPILPALKQSKSMQQEVDKCIRQVARLNEQGKFRSQRGGIENVWVKREIPWSQKYILGGSNNTRVSYDSLSMSQWVAGFSQIIREEQNTKTRNHMLEYMTLWSIAMTLAGKPPKQAMLSSYVKWEKIR